MFAIIETGGKQIIVKAGDIIYIEKIEGKEGDEIKFASVLATNEEIGTPYLKNVVVTGKIEKQGKAKKIVVYRHNPKSTHKRKLGHRQPYTRVKILAIKGVK
ncbi:50S ribosomal protein L21 [Metamycoplasma hyosynoviae]|uniref:Large ribosomal subunit protein bL21 n=1 Tax=Metamycoplasma hyosynoviae TaxID=29559 RepID=A0A063YD70_9BACT|nr:50S ribosomal protein L21 [Metamycoplasma hyosynoviae]ASI54074.1 50S ribosomal protein L21 [Metamycoplasma hyosynoviae]KDE41647.1 50S ribosomal protein L21 [Metamycoplasma hyosynoviae]KDE41744.1 50S ribosomal protein L21 [Metamycoplasma hyosynoviae]KDE42852.1 50S ribosomal protein L21 [Metamycoplasma hyosynoviae]KDE43858.1 50S ribosomal protein L21 [Metamycoplasma hyosynoviae]